MSEVIKVIRGAEVSPGMWAYAVPSLRLCGRSRQPLLDACRQIKSILGGTGRRAALFREGRELADISCPVNVGAATAVKEGNGDGPRFAPYVPFPRQQASAPSRHGRFAQPRNLSP